MRRSEALFVRQKAGHRARHIAELREPLRVVWELFKRRPFLASLPVFAVVWIAHRDLLERWIDEAYEAIGARVDG